VLQPKTPAAAASSLSANMVRQLLPIGLFVISMIGLCALLMGCEIEGDKDFQHRSILSSETSKNEKSGTIKPWSVPTKELRRVSSHLSEIFGQKTPAYLECPPINDTKYSHLRARDFHVLMVTNTYMTEELLPSQIMALAELTEYIGPSKVGWSIHESGSRDLTRQIIEKVIPKTAEIFGLDKSDLFINTSVTPIDWKSENRIKIMGDLRMEALKPLFSERGKRFGIYFFFNDVGLCARDFLEMLHHHFEQDAHMSCSMDWKIGKNGPYFYDEWVFRDINGHLVQPQSLYSLKMDGSHDWFRQSPFSYVRWKAQMPFQVYACWNGMAILAAEPIRKKVIRYRRSAPGECAESECHLICKDYWQKGYGRIQIIPTVNVGYNLAESRVFQKYNELPPQEPENLNPIIVWRPQPKKVFCLSQPERNGRDVSPWYQEHRYVDTS